MRDRTLASLLFLVAVLVPVAADAQLEHRKGFDGKRIEPGKRIAIGCVPDDGMYLVGLIEFQTDRLVGLAHDCVKATSEQRWDTEHYVHNLGFGNRKATITANKSCPPDSFMVGLKATFGSDAADTHGMAHAEPVPLIADLSPVCRNSQDVFFELNRGRLDQAEDNELHDVPWDGIGGARSCRAGYAVSRIVFSYDGRRDLDPANPFYDAAVTCKRLPLNIKVRTGR